jgi:hypothetical protein
MNRIIVAVPGPWRDRTELMHALMQQDKNHMFAGSVFFEQSTRTNCEFEFWEHDPEFRRTVEIAGQGLFSPAELDAVAAHGSIALLLLDEPGYETARVAARFAGVLLEAGGLAVKVESAGVAHTKQRWLELSASPEPFDIYTLFVVLVDAGDGRDYSCGMHNFGLPDAAVPSALGNEESARMLNIFNMYRLVENPVLKTGETFSLDADSPRFRLKHGPFIDGYEPDTPLYNPHGLWSLELPQAAAPIKRRWRLPW